MGKLLMVLGLLAITFLDRCLADQKVSFYGASYIHLSIQEAKSTTDISFRFRTHLSDAMLLFAAGRIDYCHMKLESGRLKVHINLGAGEKGLSSPHELPLNDFSWHEVNLTRRDANIVLRIDTIHSTSDILPGRFFELNINFGVYIGGQGGFNEIFLGHTEYLRGCMADIVYNGIQVVDQARNRNLSEVTAVSWGCSAEFKAGPKNEISFVEDGAFTIFPWALPRTGSRWEVELKTVAETGLLLYNTGRASYADFFGVELVDSKIRILMNKGNGPTELIHKTIVSDGSWHIVKVDFSPNFLGISIDGEIQNISLHSGNRYLDLAETLYIGGAELSRRAKALNKGFKSGDISYKGCIRNMLLDNRELTLNHVKVSQGLVVNCVWGFSCAEAIPCVPNAICSQLGLRSFKCTCDQQLCIKSNYTEDYNYKYNNNLPVNLEIISLQPVSVEEGKQAILGKSHINIILDIAKFGMNESFVVLAVLTPPAHGILIFDKMPIITGKTRFTMADVYQHKISYHHDDSESLEDSIIMKIAFVSSSSRFHVPSFLQDSLRFTLSVNITPVNDPPRLELDASHSVLRLAQGTRKTLTRNLFWTFDSDTPNEALVYTILQNNSDIGYVERMTAVGAYSGQPTFTFTQAELKQGLVDYVDTGKNKTKTTLGLKVSDGQKSTAVQFLRVNTYPLSIRLKFNTGLIVVHNTFSFISSANLSFTTNAEDSRININYSVIKSPKYGLLQRQRDSHLPWIPTDQFDTHDLELKSIRYLHSSGTPHHDSFTFKTSVRELRLPTIYDFNINFITLELQEIQRSSINFTNRAEVFIDSSGLKFQTYPLKTDPSMIIYSLLESPKYGNIFRLNERLRVGQVFTQQDIDEYKIQFKLLRRAFSPVKDYIIFKVIAPQCIDVTTSMTFYYQPLGSIHIDGVENLDVFEGGSVALRVKQKNYHDFGVTALSFTLTELPRHGFLAVYNNSLPIRFNTSYFTTEELEQQSVYYVHDDSETTIDYLEYLAISVEEMDFMYIGNFFFYINLKNDNKPVRVNRKIFHVVSKSEKLLTRADLLFIDNDDGTKPSNLIYNVKQIRHGKIFRINEPMLQLIQFSQQDIDDEKIVFKHQGNYNYGRIDFTVTDGELITDDELEVQAGDPYVKLWLSDTVVVQSNCTVFFTEKEIDVETNVNANATDIKYTVLARPNNGTLLKYDQEIFFFDKNDLLLKFVSYKHNGFSSVKRDQFQLKVNVKGTEDVGILTVKVFSESFWEPLTVFNNNTVYVEEATSVLLTRHNLEIGHPYIPTNSVTYYIKESPKNGYLDILSGEQNVEDADNNNDETQLIKNFGQNMVNDGRVYYIQSMPNKTHDKFVVDVTNSITWLKNLTINIIIVPDKLFVASRNLTVLEGKSVILHESDFFAETFYFTGRLTDYRITEKPKHGSFVDIKNMPVRKFTHRELRNREIFYKNNGDEVLTDYFKMDVRAGEKSSEPFTVWINILPINDEEPIVINKTKFSIWQGGSIIVNREILDAVDKDTQPNGLTYEIKNLINGYFSLKEYPGIKIYNFTQDLINKNQVSFTHTNGSEAEFFFTVSDKVHTTKLYHISIDTKPVGMKIELNRRLKVFPLTKTPFNSEILLSKCSDAARDIIYFIKSGPKMGHILMEKSDGSWSNIDRFTQKDLNNSKIFYDHNKQFNNFNASDSFTFDIKTYWAPSIKNQIFNIVISIASGGLHRFVPISAVKVKEGESANFHLNISGIVSYVRTKVTKSHPEISIKLMKQPDHGHVMLFPDLNLTTYTQIEAESNKMLYFHDDSDTLKDQIDFYILFFPGHLNLCNISIPVEIEPKDDQPFKLEIFNGIHIVQNQTQTITRDVLLTTDPDTEPNNIVYQVVDPPNDGRLLLLSPDSNTEIRQALKFTQEDIDSSRLIFEHSGNLSSTSFYFFVSDKHTIRQYQIFNIFVHPIRLNITFFKPVKLQQGISSIIIGTDSFLLNTNVRHDHIFYEVTDSPKHGVLHIRNQTNSFKHTDLLSKNVIYEQKDMSFSNDSFKITARINDFKLPNIIVLIRVTPLMIINPNLDVYAGDRTKLALSHFDATPLHRLSGSDPAFKITRKPKYARIMRIVNRTMLFGERQSPLEKDISVFLHSQVRTGLIYLVCKEVPSKDAVQDYFEYVLTVPQIVARYQPAIGVFYFRVKLNNDYYNNTLYGPLDPVGHEGKILVAPNMSEDTSLALGMLLGVFSFGLCLVIIIRCNHNKYKDPTEKDEEEQIEEDYEEKGKDHNHEEGDIHKYEINQTSIISLPRPPNHLMPVTPHLKRYTNEHQISSITNTPVPSLMPANTTTLPQCKIIPLNPVENMTGSEVDNSFRYPYGMSDVDEWNSFDTTELPCPSHNSQLKTTSNPLLRRNQYWV